MKNEKTTPTTLGAAYAHLTDNGDVLSVPVDERFWTEGISQLPPGRLISVLESASDWTSWEMHPEGDEFILVLSGRLVLHMDDAGQRWSEEVAAGQFVIIPRGVWHTADVREPGRSVFVTAGANTQHRKRTSG